jgi:hypothetical protein
LSLDINCVVCNIEESKQANSNHFVHYGRNEQTFVVSSFTSFIKWTCKG